MVSFYDIYSQSKKDGQEDRRTRTIGQYFQQAAQGDKAAQQQVYAVDPSAGMQAQKFGQEQEENDLESVARAANFFANTRDPKAYSYLQSRLSTMPQFAGLPATLDTPEDQEGAVKFAQSLAQTYGKGAPAELAPRVVGRSLVDATGKVLFEAPEEQEYQWSERAGAWIPKPRAGGGAAKTFEDGSRVPPPSMNGTDGMPVTIDPGMSAEDIKAVQAMEGGPIPGQFSNGPGRPLDPPGLAAIPVAGIGPKPDEQSDIERRIQLAKSLGASDDEIRQMVVGRDGAAAGAKPMPTAALKMIQDETNAANSAQAINASLSKQLDRIKAGKLDFGPVSNLTNRARNAVGASTEESRNYQEFVSDLERLRNDSLRLNSGVQTDGDAQRAWNELFANINDTQYVKQRLETIRMLNQRAEQLRRLNVDMIRENYGKGEGGAPAPTAAPAGPRRLKFNPATGKLE